MLFPKLGVAPIAMTIVFTITTCFARQPVRETWFTGVNAKLETAIDADNAAALQTATNAGANVNAKGKAGLTPLEYAVGHGKKKAFLALLRLHADPDQRDDEKDNAITLAVNVFPKDPEYLVTALQSGGNPNTLRPNNDPILGGFEARHDLQGIRTLVQLGADINAQKRNGLPLILDAALANDWDVVWLFLQLGAKFDYLSGPTTIQKVFLGPETTPRSSPLYADKKKAWTFITQHGIVLPPLDATRL